MFPKHVDRLHPGDEREEGRALHGHDMGAGEDSGIRSGGEESKAELGIEHGDHRVRSSDDAVSCPGDPDHAPRSPKASETVAGRGGE